MNKKFGVVGYKGKLGSIISGRTDFVSIDCDITKLHSIEDALVLLEGLDVIVNLAAISSVDECERDYEKALEVNRTGLANLHRMFGDRVLNISSDQVFSGNSLILPSENSSPKPINAYGFTKLGAEAVSMAFGGKTLRLSRTVSLEDYDVWDIIDHLLDEDYVMGRINKTVPTFFARNYMHREFAVDAIEYMVRNWDNMPQIVNYGGLDHVTMFGFMKMLVMELGLDYNLLQKNNKYDNSMTPRPRNGGFKVRLAKDLGFPMYSIIDTVSKLKEDFGEQSSYSHPSL